MKKTEQMPENVSIVKANCSGCTKETKQKQIPWTPIHQDDKNQIQLGINAAKAINWRLHEFLQELSEIENGLFIVEYDEMPIANCNNKLVERFVTELEEIIRSGNQLNYFKSNIVHLHNCLYIIKADMKRIGEKLGIKLNKKTLFRVHSHVQYLGSLKSFEKLLQEIYEDISSLKYDLKRLLEFDGIDEGTADMAQELMTHERNTEMQEETMPRAPIAPVRQNEDSTESQSPNSKSDLQNCLNYVKNQCGNHTLNQMAELLNCRLL